MAVVITVGVVDDHQLITGALRTNLDAEPDIQVVWSAQTLREAREALANETVDVVLIDVRLPDGSGLQLLPGDEPASGPAFIVISAFDRPAYAVTAFRRGAAGLLLKAAPPIEIVDAVRRAAAGRLAFDARHLDIVRSNTSLTPRELEVVRLVAETRSNDEIAARLDISTKTVEACLRDIFRKYGFQSRMELAMWAVDEGWTENL